MTEFDTLIAFLKRIQAIWDAHRWEKEARKALRQMCPQRAEAAIIRARELTVELQQLPGLTVQREEHTNRKGGVQMQEPMIPCDVADLENVQAYLLSVKALLELVIRDSESSAANTICKSVADSFDCISTALNGVHMLIVNILDYSTETINKAFKAHKAAQKEGKRNDEAEADRA